MLCGASASITEIMYDLPGTDTGREWIEIQNTGSEDISFSKWKLFEANTNHGLILFQGSATTSANGFVIIADDPAKFVTDNPAYSGSIFDSSFSLSNTGETLSLKFENAVIDEVTYASTMGAAGDGNSLQKISGSWQAKSPTPGSAAAPSSSSPLAPTENTATTTQEDTPSEQTTPSSQSNRGIATIPLVPQIYITASAPQKEVAGAPALFSAIALGTKKEPLQNARYVWSFGDGGTGEGKKIQHIYHYPASYVVMVTASSGEWNATDRKEITIIASTLRISHIKEGSDGFVEVDNFGKDEINLSNWVLLSGSSTFTIPEGTLIGVQKAIPFPSAITNIQANSESTALLYPNGRLVARYIPEDIVDSAPSGKTPESEAPIVSVEKKTEEKKKEVSAAIAVQNSPVKEKETEAIISAASSTLPPASPANEVQAGELIGAVGAVPEGHGMTFWLGGVGVLLAFSVGGYMTLLRPKPEESAAEHTKKEAARFDIIE